MQEEKRSQKVWGDLARSRENFRQTFALIDLFAVIYEPITRLTLATVENKTARMPEITQETVVQFHGVYDANRARFLQNKTPETHWQPYYAFIKTHKNVRALQATEVRDLLFRGIEAHILHDFPFVLAPLIARYGRESVRAVFDEATPVFVIARDEALQTLGEAARRNRVNMPTAWVMKRHARVLDTLDAAQSVKSLLRMREKAWQIAISWEKMQSRDKI
jgi:hypothetical protein